VLAVPAGQITRNLLPHCLAGIRYGAIFAYWNDFYKGVMDKKFGNKVKDNVLVKD
jgi:hypothetical protein